VIVLDSSALLALLQREPGAERVEELLPESVMSTANVAEVLAKAADRDLDVATQHELLASLGIRVEPVITEDAVLSALIRQADTDTAPVLSLGDRLCLSLALRLELPAVTADRAWTNVEHGVVLHLIR